MGRKEQLVIVNGQVEWRMWVCRRKELVLFKEKCGNSARI